MPPRILQTIVEEEEDCTHSQSEEDPSQDHEDVEERLRTIVGPAIQATLQSPPGNVDRRSGLPLSQLLNPIIHPMPPLITRTNYGGPDYSGLPYLNNRLYVKRQDTPPSLLQLESHFNQVYEASLAAAAAAATSSPLSRWFGDLTTTPPPESSDEDLGGMREADELDSSSNSDSDNDSSDWWKEDEEPAPGSPPSAVIAPAPHLVLPINIWRIEVSALQYTPPASPADREMEMVSTSSLLLVPRPRYSRLLIKKVEEEEGGGGDEEEEEAGDVLSSSTMCRSPSGYSTTKDEEEGIDAVKTEVTVEEIQVAIKSEAEAEVEVEVEPNVKLEDLVKLSPALVLVPGHVPALASEHTAGVEPMVRKRSRQGWTSINGPDAKRRKLVN